MIFLVAQRVKNTRINALSIYANAVDFLETKLTWTKYWWILLRFDRNCVECKVWWFLLMICQHNGLDDLATNKQQAVFKRLTMTSQWARWRLKSPGSRLFTQPLIQTQIKENTKAPRHLPFVRGIQRSPVNSPHKWPVTRKMFPFDDVIMEMVTLLWFYFDATLKIARHTAHTSVSGRNPKQQQLMIHISDLMTVITCGTAILTIIKRGVGSLKVIEKIGLIVDTY